MNRVSRPNVITARGSVMNTSNGLRVAFTSAMTITAAMAAPMPEIPKPGDTRAVIHSATAPSRTYRSTLSAKRHMFDLPAKRTRAISAQ
jgi:hypothetical protein